MRSKLLFCLIVLSLLFSSCLIKSFNPFYKAQNVVFNTEIFGEWISQDNTEWSFEEMVTEKSLFKSTPAFQQYKVSYKEEDGGESRFITTLFELDGQQYLDFFPDLEMISDKEMLVIHTLPVHSLAKINISESGIEIKWFNEEWLFELIKEKKTSIAHQKIHYSGDEDGTIVLTASTEDIQTFIKKFAKDPKAFDCDDQYSGDTFCKKLKRR